MNSFFNSILELLFPDTCLGCRAPGAPVCHACLSKVGQGPRLPLENTTALFPYRTPLIQQALWRLKYRQKKRIAEVFGVYLHEALMEELGKDVQWRPGETPRWILLPIPSSQKRESRRGYNQAAELAKSVARIDAGAYFDYHEHALTKIRETESQVSMKNRQARLSNLVGSFNATDPELIRGRTCVVIDDITTTGATIIEAHRALQAARALKVIALTVAA